MTDSNATELLRKLLDERGIEYKKLSNIQTVFYDVDGNRFTYIALPESGWTELFMGGYHITPEQAVAATLGVEKSDPTERWLLGACNQAAQDYVAQLEQERDELKSKLEAATLGADDESRWYELFGTPERAAQTLADDCPGGACGGCPGLRAEECGLGDYDVLLEWLRGKAVR